MKGFLKMTVSPKPRAEGSSPSAPATSEQVALVPIFYAIKNRSPALLFLLFREKSRLACFVKAKSTMLRFPIRKTFARFLAFHLHKKARLFRLFACKRAHNASRFTTTFLWWRLRRFLDCFIISALTTASGRYQPFLICAPAAHDVSTIRTFYIKASIHTLVPVFNWWALCNSVSKPP